MSDLYQLTRLNADLMRENEKLQAELDALKEAAKDVVNVLEDSMYGVYAEPRDRLKKLL